MFGLHTIVIDSLENCTEVIDEVCYELTSTGMLLEGDEIIVIAGRMASNEMKEQLQVVKLAGGNNTHGRIMTRNESFFFNRDLLLQYSTAQ